MNLLEIFHYEYKKHKTLIWFYIGLCVFCAVFCGPFINQLFGPNVLAVEVPELGTASNDETIFALATVFSRSEILKIAGAYSNIVGVAADPITAICFIGLMENINNVLGHPLNIISTPAGNPWILLCAAICFCISKILKANGTTKIFDLCTLDELEKYIGLVFVLLVGVMNVCGLTNAGVALAASPIESVAGPGAGTVIITTASVVISVIMSIVSVVVYFVIKTVIKGIDILQACFSFVPYSSLICEVLKTIFVVAIILINIVFPWLGWIINIIVFIICCFFFRTCFNITLFLHRIYIRPFLRGLKGYSKSFPLVSSKLPKRIRKYYEEKNKELKLAIPVYIQKAYTIEGFKTKKLQRVWLINNEDGTFLVKKKAGKKKVSTYELIKPEFEVEEYTGDVQDILHKKASENYHIRKGFRYIEIFKYLDNDKNLSKKNPKKSISIIMSREYSERYNDILEITGHIDYDEIKEQKKFAKKQIRKEKTDQIKEKISNTTKSITKKINPKAIEALDDNNINKNGDNENGNN